MPTQIELKTTLGSIIIDVLENEFMTEFIEKMKQNNELFHIHAYHDNIPYHRYSWNQSKIDELEILLKDSINELNVMGLEFPIPVEDIVLQNDDATRDLLNRLHRHFTTSNNSESTWNFKSTHTFTVPRELNERFHELVHKINYAVHETEVYVTSSHVQDFRLKYREYQIIFDRSKPKVDYIMPTVTGYENRAVYFSSIKEEHKKYFSTSSEYDVWLTLTQVHGKNYHICYFDMDDPNEYDVECNQFYSGSFTLTDRRIARDPQIQNWLRSNGIEPGPEQCGIPIGNVVQGKEFMYKLPEHAITEIVITKST